LCHERIKLFHRQEPSAWLSLGGRRQFTRLVLVDQFPFDRFFQDCAYCTKIFFTSDRL